jgi:hypothetical protein
MDMTSQYNRYQLSKEPHADQVIPLHHLKVRYCCAVSAQKIIRPVLFKDGMNF